MDGLNFLQNAFGSSLGMIAAVIIVFMLNGKWLVDYFAKLQETHHNQTQQLIQQLLREVKLNQLFTAIRHEPYNEEHIDSIYKECKALGLNGKATRYYKKWQDDNTYYACPNSIKKQKPPK
jgi:hypothetical protein